MNKKFFKFAGYTISGMICGMYVLFLAAPLFVNGYLKSHKDEILNQIKEISGGYNFELSEIKLVTTPKLTVGLEIEDAKFYLPNQKEFLSADNFEVKLSLIPLIARRIELDKLSVKNTELTIDVLDDGRFMIEDFIPKTQGQSVEDSDAVSGLPLGLRLSNHLPNIYMKNYAIAFVDSKSAKRYYLDGDEFNITDFIFNKKVKLKANGEVILDGETQFSYNMKVDNHIMPSIELHDIVFPENILEDNSDNSTNTSKDFATISFNIIDIFNTIHKNSLCANLTADLKLSGTIENPDYVGNIRFDGVSVAVDGKKLPESFLNIDFNGNRTKFDSIIYTAFSKEENTEFSGDIKNGKNPEFNFHLKSNAGINNLINLVDSIAKSFGINDFDTLSGSGNLDADFLVSGNTKQVKSYGYLKVPTSTVKYGLYNILIDKITADVNFENNNIDIKNISFSVLNQPLKLTGNITDEAFADLHLTADKLPIKGLVATAGQIALLRENEFKSGTVSMDAALRGKLSNSKPSINLSVNDVNIKNKPMSTSLLLDKGTIDISTDGKSFSGLVRGSNVSLQTPIAPIKIPETIITIGENDIEINKTNVLLYNSKINLAGVVSDYSSKDILIDISANGNLFASDVKNMIPAELRVMTGSAKGVLPLNLHITGNDKSQNINVVLTATPENYFSILDIDLLKGRNTTIKSSMKLSNDMLKFSNTGIYAGDTSIATMDGNITNLSTNQKLELNLSIPSLIGMPIPGFGKKSLITCKGALLVGGTLLNPTLKGSVSIPDLKIPDMNAVLSSMELNFAGALAKGHGTLGRLTFGGIIADNLSSDFVYNPVSNIVYLKNISGTAFSGKVGGNLSYNLNNGKVGVNLTGNGLDAISAIAGAAGIKNALSGKLTFRADVTTLGASDVEMMKNLKGNLTFEVSDGAFLSIGKIEHMLSASNIMANIVMKTAVATLSSISVIKDSANFKYIKGNMSFNAGWANISSIKISGPSMAYYITGKYNMLNGSANLVILGRLGSDVVAALGPIGELSVSKLTSYIPKFGAATASIINSMTTNPKVEKISEIPPLSSGNTTYKDFKVIFNGGIESNGSVKSFKWLSNPDMSAIQAPNLKQQIQTSAGTIKKDVTNQIEAAKNVKEQSTQNIKDQVQNVKDSVNEIKNLFKF